MSQTIIQDIRWGEIVCSNKTDGSTVAVTNDAKVGRGEGTRCFLMPLIANEL